MIPKIILTKADAYAIIALYLFGKNNTERKNQIMKTRIFALLLAVMCLFAFAACKEEPTETETPDTAFSLYTAANTQLSKLKDGVDLEMNISIAMNVGGAENSTTMTMIYKACGNNIYGQMGDETVTYVDGMMYILSEYDIGDGPETTKEKSEVSLEDATEYFEAVVVALPTVTEEALANVTWTEENGIRTFQLPIEKENYLTALATMMGEENSDSMDGDTIDTFTVNVSFDANDKLVAISFSLVMQNDYLGNYTYTQTINFKTLGSPVEITAPADADSYELLEWEDDDWDEDWEDEDWEDEE